MYEWGSRTLLRPNATNEKIKLNMLVPTSIQPAVRRNRCAMRFDSRVEASFAGMVGVIETSGGETGVCMAGWGGGWGIGFIGIARGSLSPIALAAARRTLRLSSVSLIRASSAITAAFRPVWVDSLNRRSSSTACALTIAWAL